MLEDTVQNTSSRRFSCHGVLVALALVGGLAVAGCSAAKASGGGDGGTDAGSSAWQTVGGAKVAPGSAYSGRVAASGGTSYAAYVDSMTSKLTVASSSGGTWAPLGSAGFTPDTVTYNGFAIAVDNGTPYVAYESNSNYGVTVMKFNGTAWTLVGAGGFATGSYDGVQLVVANGVPSVAFTDGNSVPHIMSFAGTSWTDLGATTLPTSASYVVLGVGSDGTLYVAFNDTSKSLLVLMKYSGTTWTQAATSTVMISESWAPNLTVSNGTVFLTYKSSADGAVVMKLVGSALVSVGTLGSISNGDYIEYVTGAVYNGVPYVAFDDEARDSDPNPMAATVKTFDGSSWTLFAGYPDPSDIEDTFLYMDPSNGKLYLTYSDGNGDMTVQVH
jgi:hypothetical protein